MSSGPTKSWLTPARLERGPEAAEAELKRWNLTEEDKAEFRRLFGEKWTPHGRLEDPKGVVEKLRKADEKAQKAEAAIGKFLTAKEKLTKEKRDKLVTELRRRRVERRLLARRLARATRTGAPYMHKALAYEKLVTPVGFAIGALVAVGGGYLIGRWWRGRRQASARARVHGLEHASSAASAYAPAPANPYLVGAAVLGAYC